MTKKYERISTLLKEITAHRSAMREERLKRMAAFLESVAKYRQTSTRRGTATFNVFKLLKVGNDEVKHSSFLAWLLDEKANHNQGNIFFQEFLRTCRITIPEDILSRYYVRTEYARTESIVDIAVYKKRGFLFYLENKVDAEESEHQLEREFRDMRQLGTILSVPSEQQFAVFLTPDGRQPSSCNPNYWQTLSYNQIKITFEKLINHIEGDKMRYTLTDWLDIISTFGR